jgi:hypothetical protein
LTFTLGFAPVRDIDALLHIYLQHAVRTEFVQHAW